MPDGPLLLSPDRTAQSLYREVIIKRPDLFKVDCLSAIKNLFPENSEPFYAGFGNRDTDAVSYKAVEIKEGKIFIINPKGIIKQFHNDVYCKSYPEINLMVDMMFPAVQPIVGLDLEEAPLVMKHEPTSENYNDYNFWKPEEDGEALVEEFLNQ